MYIEIICPGCKKMIECHLPIPLEYGDGKMYACKECKAYLFQFKIDEETENKKTS